jgi:hypothetical protein
VAVGELSDPAAVGRALEEFDSLGREAFLQAHGFIRARSYFIQYKRHYYDSKAIAGVACGYQFPERGTVTPGQFPGRRRKYSQTFETPGL